MQLIIARIFGLSRGNAAQQKFSGAAKIQPCGILLWITKNTHWKLTIPDRSA
jgi:hypothetical protein